MKEYSTYIVDRLNHEAEIRGALRKYIEEHRAQLSEGFGISPGAYAGYVQDRGRGEAELHIR